MDLSYCLHAAASAVCISAHIESWSERFVIPIRWCRGKSSIQYINQCVSRTRCSWYRLMVRSLTVAKVELVFEQYNCEKSINST